MEDSGQLIVKLQGECSGKKRETEEQGNEDVMVVEFVGASEGLGREWRGLPKE